MTEVGPGSPNFGEAFGTYGSTGTETLKLGIYKESFLQNFFGGIKKLSPLEFTLTQMSVVFIDELMFFLYILYFLFNLLYIRTTINFEYKYLLFKFCNKILITTIFSVSGADG
jgi:hypothetical protein